MEKIDFIKLNELAKKEAKLKLKNNNELIKDIPNNLNQEELNEFIDYLIWKIHDLTSIGDCVYEDCLDRLKNKEYEEFKKHWIRK